MGLHKLTVELSDEEIAVLRQLAKRDDTSLNTALRNAIAQAGYLLGKESSGQQVFVGKVRGSKLTGNQINHKGCQDWRLLLSFL